MMTDFAIIRRNLRARLFSTVTTALIVAAAVGLLLGLITLRDATRSALARGSGNMQLILSADASPLAAVLNGIFYANPPSRVLKWPACEELLKKYPVDYALPIQQLETFHGFPLVATVPQYFSAFQPDASSDWKIADGALFKSEFDVVAGASAARALQLKVGATFQLPRHPAWTYRISGILQPTGTSHDRALYTDLNDAWLHRAQEKRKLTDPTLTQAAPLTAAALADSDKLVTCVYVRFKNAAGNDASPALLTAYDGLKGNHPELTVALPAAESDKLLAIASTLDSLLMACAAVVVLAAAVAILLTLYNSLEQRRRQAALFRVMGCSQARIFGWVVTEAALIGLAGALLGALLSLAITPLAAAALDAKFGLVLQPFVQLLPALAVILVSVLLSGAAGIVPAWLASRTSVPAILRQPVWGRT